MKAVTAHGILNLYGLVFLCMETREVIVSSSTQHPNSAWVKVQTEAFIKQAANWTEKPAIMMHDCDTKFTKEFVAVLKSKGIRTNARRVASPNLKGRVKRFIQSIERECLGKFVLFGRKHLDHIVAEWVEYYSTRRSHMVREHLLPVREKPDEVLQIDRNQIVARSYIG